MSSGQEECDVQAFVTYLAIIHGIKWKKETWRMGKGGRMKEERKEKTHKHHVISAKAMIGLQAKDKFTHYVDQSLLIKST